MYMYMYMYICNPLRSPIDPHGPLLLTAVAGKPLEASTIEPFPMCIYIYIYVYTHNTCMYVYIYIYIYMW